MHLHRGFCILKSGGHNSLDGVHAVFCLVKDDGSFALEDLVGDFHAGDAELIVDLLADDGVQIVECGQAVHEAALGTGICHQFGSDTVCDLRWF